jgi:hypothetical protein
MDLIRKIGQRQSFLTRKEVMGLSQVRRNTVRDIAQPIRIPASGHRFDPRVLDDAFGTLGVNPRRRVA